MTEIITSRRSFITGLAVLVASPAIVRAGSLMPVKVMEAVGNFNLPFMKQVVIATLNGVPIYADGRFQSPEDMEGFVPMNFSGWLPRITQEELDNNALLRAIMEDGFNAQT